MNKNQIKTIIRTRYFDSLYRKRKLVSATVEILNICNFKCIHCYNQDIKHCVMDKQTAFNIIDQMKELGLERITITGGDPFMHPNFREIYEYCYEKNLEIAIFTNGYLIDKYLDLLISKPPKQIEISLYGMDNDTYNKICKVEDGFTKVSNNIDLIIKNNLNLKLKTVIMMQNYLQYDSMIDFCKKRNLNFKAELSILKSKNFENNQTETRLQDEVYSLMFKKIKAEKIEIWKTNYEKAKIKENQHLLYSCGAGKISLFVSSCGDISLCTFATFSNKNIKDYSVKEIWDSFKEYLILEQDNNSKCAQCKYRVFCTNCPVMSYLEHQTNGKSILPVEQNCREAEYIYESVNKE